MREPDMPAEESTPDATGGQRADKSPPSPPKQRPMWPLLVAMLCGALLALGGVGVWMLRGSLPAVTAATLDEAVRRWEENGPANYDLEVVLGGNSPGTFQLEVRQGRVQSPPLRNGVPSARAPRGKPGPFPANWKPSPANWN